jgi:hypothetical protein
MGKRPIYEALHHHEPLEPHHAKVADPPCHCSQPRHRRPRRQGLVEQLEVVRFIEHVNLDIRFYVRLDIRLDVRLDLVRVGRPFGIAFGPFRIAL